MGMTINEAIHDTEVMKEYLEYRGEVRSEGLDVAIEIMRKYQKIQEIINNTGYIQEDVIRYQMICEVVKDGN